MNQHLQILIVDDETQSRALIKKLLADFFPGTLVEEASDVTTAVEKINTQRPDLIFLDIQMRGETGFDLLDKIPIINSGIIFTTAHSEFAVKAFRYSAIDYLMKPIETEEFKIAVKKAIQKSNNLPAAPNGQLEFLQQHLKAPYAIPDKIIIATAEGFLFVAISNIIYCKAISNYTEFHITGHQKLLSSYTLGYYTELLQPHNFFRIHRSYLINLHHIKMYKRSDGGSIIMNDGEEIEVSRNNKEAFLKLFKA